MTSKKHSVTLSRRPAHGGKGDWRHDKKTISQLLLPFAILFILMFILPIGYAVYESLFKLQRSSNYAAPSLSFSGLQNYVSAFTDPGFLSGLRHIFEFGIGPSLTLVVLSVCIALLVDSRISNRLTTFFRLAFFAPYAVPAVIGATLWGYLYSNKTSPVLSAFHKIGITLHPLIGSPLWPIGNIAIWSYTGFNVIILLSNLGTINPELIESAKLDGAGQIRIALSIKLPLLRPTLLLIAIFNVIGTMQLFTEPIVMRSISNSVTSGWTPNMYAYGEASTNNYNYSAALSVALACATAILSFGLLKFATRKSGDTSEK